VDELTRRDAIQRSAGAGLLATLGPGAMQEPPPAEGEKAPAEVPKTERGRVLAVGMTEGEADCWELAANLAGKYFALPELHPTDRQEVATAIHIIQNKLLGRPTYRRYLEGAKAVKPK
jgi:hypothetical protein